MGIVFLFVFYLLVCVITGYGEAYRIKDVENYSELWHNLQFLERAGFLGSGIFLTHLFGFVWWLLPIIFLMAVIFFIVYDGIINVVALNKNFFYVSDTSEAFTEKYASVWIKIPLLILVLVGNALLFNIYKSKDLK